MNTLERLIISVLSYLNAGGYYKTAEEIQNAINVTSLDLYKRLRGNLAQYAPGRPSSSVYPEATTASADAVSELYRIYTVAPAGDIFKISGGSRTADLVMSLEVAYTPSGPYYPVNIVPDNQFLMLRDNPVVPPIQKRPLGRMAGPLQFEVAPVAVTANARVLTLPNPVSFSFVDIAGEVYPQITNTNGTTPINDIDWSADKLDNLIYGTISGLGFNLSNGVLVQSGNAMNDKVL